jgi:hypothetical protein
MYMDERRNAWLPWASVGLLVSLCGVLAVLQYHWIGEISSAERQNLQASLRDRLNNLQRDFDEELSNSERALQPAAYQVDKLGREAAYSAQYLRWKQTNEPLFRHIALAVPQGERLELHNLDLETARFFGYHLARGVERYGVPPAAAATRRALGPVRCDAAIGTVGSAPIRFGA